MTSDSSSRVYLFKKTDALGADLTAKSEDRSCSQKEKFVVAVVYQWGAFAVHATTLPNKALAAAARTNGGATGAGGANGDKRWRGAFFCGHLFSPGGR